MQKIELTNLTEEQTLVVDVLINEGKLRALEDLLQTFQEEYSRTATEDPYYGYYVKHIIETLEKKISNLSNE